MFNLADMAFGKDKCLYILCSVKAVKDTVLKIGGDGNVQTLPFTGKDTLAVAFDSVLRIAATGGIATPWPGDHHRSGQFTYGGTITLSPDQTTLYQNEPQGHRIIAWQYHNDGSLSHRQNYAELEFDYDGTSRTQSLCVDSNGWLYVTTPIGIQVCDQAGRVNFIIPTPKPAGSHCFGGKDLSELFIACGDTIYKRATKAKGVVSGQQAPIKPPAPKL